MEDRCSDITLLTGQQMNVGQRLKLTATINRVDGEYQLSNVVFLDIVDGSTPQPLGMTSKAIGNNLTESLNYSGVSTVGLLVRCVGCVTSVNSSVRVIYVNDGGGRQDGVGGVLGIRVVLPADADMSSIDDNVVIAGVSRITKFILSVAGNVNGVPKAAGTIVYAPCVYLRSKFDL